MIKVSANYKRSEMWKQLSESDSSSLCMINGDKNVNFPHMVLSKYKTYGTFERVVHYSLFSLRKLRCPWVLNGERRFHGVNRLYILVQTLIMCTSISEAKVEGRGFL